MSSRGHHRYGGGGGGRGPPSPPPPRGHHDLRRPFPDDPFPRGGGGGGLRPPLHPALLEEQLHLQHQDLQTLLVDNQRLAATHVALKQELSAAQHELHRASHAAKLVHAEGDAQLREMYEKSAKMEMDARAAEMQRAELMQIRADIQKLNAARQELTGQVQALGQDLTRASADLQQVPAIKAEIEAIKQELARGRSAIEYEKRAYAETFEQGQIMEKNLVAMAREVEKLRTELANAEKRAQAPAASGNPGAAYGGNYGNPDPGYGGNSYPAAYGMNPVQGAADGTGLYGSGHGSWNAYEMQRGHMRR